MKKMRMISLVLLMALFAGILTGCGKNNTEATLDKQRWEETLQYETLDEVRASLGEPTKGASWSYYYSVSLGGVPGQYLLSTFSPIDPDNENTLTGRCFQYIVGGDDTPSKDLLTRAQTDFDSVLRYLTKKYGEPSVRTSDTHCMMIYTRAFTPGTTIYTWQVEGANNSSWEITLYRDAFESSIFTEDLRPNDPLDEEICLFTVIYQ